MLKFFFILFVFFATRANAQYTGGSNDGFLKIAIANQNTLPNIYTGGNNDGYLQSAVLNQNALPNIYTGGSNDGYVQFAVLNQNSLPNIYAGGNNDGFHQTFIINQNTLPNIYAGGNNDGFHQTIIINQNTLPNIYSGNSSDGFASKTVFGQNSLCTGDVATWNGSVSIAWENPANWDCGTLPNSNSNVLIPSGLSRYPTVSFTYEIKSLYLQPGSSVTVSPAANFKLNGN
ncbi:hypothetical protein [Ferruginibacter sp.]